jgi:hypothetical protein
LCNPAARNGTAPRAAERDSRRINALHGNTREHRNPPPATNDIGPGSAPGSWSFAGRVRARPLADCRPGSSPARSRCATCEVPCCARPSFGGPRSSPLRRDPLVTGRSVRL